MQNNLFIATGKTGTSTLWDLPDNYSQFTDSYLAIADINRRLESNPSLDMFVIIRNPEERFISGLFEEVAERMVKPVMQSMNLDPSVCKSLVLDPAFWTANIKNYLFLVSSNVPNRLTSTSYSYHAGNWLYAVSLLLSAYPQLRAVELNQFGKLLQSVNLPPLNINQNVDKFNWISPDLAHRNLIKIFKQGYDAVDTEIRTDIDRYLASEKQLYAGIKTMNRHWHD